MLSRKKLDSFHRENCGQFWRGRLETTTLRWEREPKTQSLSDQQRMKMNARLLSFYSRCIWRIAVLGFAVALPIAAAASPNRRITPAEVLSAMQRLADWADRRTVLTNQTILIRDMGIEAVGDNVTISAQRLAVPSYRLRG
jgi:hypothetical protein